MNKKQIVAKNWTLWNTSRGKKRLGTKVFANRRHCQFHLEMSFVGVGYNKNYRIIECLNGLFLHSSIWVSLTAFLLSYLNYENSQFCYPECLQLDSSLTNLIHSQIHQRVVTNACHQLSFFRWTSIRFYSRPLKF